MKKLLITTAAMVVAAVASTAAQAQSMRLITQNQEQRAQYPAEIAAIEALSAAGVTSDTVPYQARQSVV